MNLLITLLLKNTCFFAGIYVTYSRILDCGRESTSLPFALWDLLKGGKRKRGKTGFFFFKKKTKNKNKTKTPQQRKRFNYSSELHEILLPDQGCRCYRQHASLNIHPAKIGSPQRRADLPLRFPEAFYYTTPNSDVLHLGRNPPEIDRHFFFHSSFETRAMTDMASSIFHSVTHLKQSPAGCKCTLPLLRSRLTRKFQGYNIDATYFAAFRCKNIAARLLLAQNSLCVFYLTEHFKWRLSVFFLAHYALPRTPCSSWF